MSSASENVRDFSLVVGGPLFQLLRRLDLSGSGFELLRRRIVAIVLVTWVPLLILSVAEGLAWGNAVRVPFLFDVDVNVRFLVALPVLIAAELLLYQRTRVVVEQFVSQGLVPAIRTGFDAAVANALRLERFLELRPALADLPGPVAVPEGVLSQRLVMEQGQPPLSGLRGAAQHPARTGADQERRRGRRQGNAGAQLREGHAEL